MSNSYRDAFFTAWLLARMHPRTSLDACEPRMRDTILRSRCIASIYFGNAFIADFLCTLGLGCAHPAAELACRFGSDRRRAGISAGKDGRAVWPAYHDPR